MLCGVALEAPASQGPCPRLGSVSARGLPEALLLTAPPLCCSDVLALPIFKQEEPQLSPENEARLPPLQYVLCAATSPAVKLHEETLTYLNQGSGRSAGAAAGPPYLVTVGLAGTQTVLSTSLPCALPEPPHLHLESGLPTPAVGSGGRRSCFWCRPPTGRRLGA